MNTVEELIRQFGEVLTKDIKDAIPSATGKTAASIFVEFRPLGFTIKGGAQIGALIGGRKPTSSGAAKGSPTLQENLFEWIKARNIQPRETKMTQEQLSWAFATKIHRDGYKGKGDIFANVITDSRINAFAKSLMTEQSTVVRSDILKRFKK